MRIWGFEGLGGFREIAPMDRLSEIVPQGDIVAEFDLVTLTVRDRGADPVAWDLLCKLLARALDLRRDQHG